MAKEGIMGKMKNRDFAVWIRLFFCVALIALCIFTLCCCDKEDVDSLFQPSNFCVTFVLNNGEENVVWHKGDVVPTPHKKDCEFVCWCSDEALMAKTDLDFAKLNLVNSITLYAKWREFDDMSSVVFEDAEFVYDKMPHALKVENIPDGASVTYDKKNEQIAAGKYEITATVKADGFKDFVKMATLTIKKAKVENLTFEDEEFVWDNDKKFGLYVGGDIPDEVKVSYEGNGQSEVGEHSVTAKFEVSDNFEPIADMTATLVIKEKYFDVTFDDGISPAIVVSVGHGKAVEDMPTPTQKVGYEAKWNRDSVENVLENITVNIEYTPIEYTISFVSDGEEVKKTTYNIESAVEFENATREHYTFEGWFEKQAPVERVLGLDIGNYGDKVFYARWIANDYFVTYHLDGGLNSEVNINFEDKYKFTIESDALKLADAEKEYYVFEGWFTSENFEGERVVALNKGACRNLDLYAKWAAQKFAIHYELAGGNNNENNPLFTTCESDEIVLLAPSKAHYDFVCWTDRANGKVDKIAAHNVNEIYLIAVWRATKYEITYHLFGGENGENNPYFTIEDEDILLLEPSKRGYRFVGWFENADFSGEKIEKIECSQARNIELFAKWEIETYQIVFDANGGENVQNPSIYTVESDNIVLNNPTRKGYKFEGWFDKTGRKIENIDKGSVGGVSLVAKWSVIEYTIEFDSNGGLAFEPIRYTVESETVELKPTTKAHYVFGGWFDEGGNKVERVEKGSVGNLKLKAQWIAKTYEIRFDSKGGNEVKSIFYTIETPSFDLPSCSRNNYDFVGWFGSDGGEVNRIERGSFGDMLLVAKWSAKSYTVTFESNGGSKVENMTYYGDSSCFVLPTPTRDYYKFDGWFESADLSGGAISSFSTNKDTTLYAKWTPLEYTVTFDTQGGNEMKACIYTVESDDILLAESQKDGFVFDGWYAGDTKVEKIAKGSHGDLVLTARWSEVVAPSDFTVENGVLTAYNGTDATIIIHAIEGGESVRSVAKSTFDSVRATVTKIVIDEGVESVENGTFDGMGALETLVMPSTIKTMYRGMLKDCASLVNLTVPFASFAVTDKNATEGTKYVSNNGENVFSFGFLFLAENGDSNPTNVYFNGSTYFGSEKVYVPDSLISVKILGGDICKKAFLEMGIRDIVLGKDICVVEDMAFAKMPNLTSVEIENAQVKFCTSVLSASDKAVVYLPNAEQKELFVKNNQNYSDRVQIKQVASNGQV